MKTQANKTESRSLNDVWNRGAAPNYLNIKMVNEMFKKSMPTREEEHSDGHNSILDIFLKATEQLVGVSNNFTFQDYAMSVRHYDLSPIESKALFLKWIAFLKKINKVQVVEAMDIVYCFI